jgi:hypothetical protein
MRSTSTRTAPAQDVGEQPPANRQRHLAPTGGGAAAAAAGDRAAVIVRGLQCDGLGGWRRIFSFTESKARTFASVACVAFYGPANSVKRTMPFGRQLLVVDGAPTLERLVRARERFPALCVNAIDLKGRKEITDDFIVALVEICPEMTDLNLHGCELLTDVSIVAFAGSCPLLESVILECCELLTDASIGALAGSCPLLESVNLAGCKLLTDASIGALAGSCPLLKSVDLRGCTLLTDASIAALKAALPDVSVDGR